MWGVMSTLSLRHNGDSGGSGSSVVTFERGTGEALGTKRPHQCVVVNQDAPADVDEVSVRLELCQPGRIHQMMRLRRDRHRENHEVSFA